MSNESRNPSTYPLKQAGFSLLEVITVIGLVGVISLIFVRTNTSAIQGASSVASQGSVDYIRRTITEGMDCGQSLRVVPATLPPLRCASFPSITLRRYDGAELTNGGQLGKWRVAAGCQNNEVIVSISRDGNDPLTGKAYNDAPYSRDLFNGVSDLCRPYFENRVVGDFGGTYQWYVPRGTAPVICRRPNPYTGQCNCPLGYGEFHTNEFNGASLWVTTVSPNRCKFYNDGNSGTSFCGYDGYICVRR